MKTLKQIIKDIADDPTLAAVYALILIGQVGLVYLLIRVVDHVN